MIKMQIELVFPMSNEDSDMLMMLGALGKNNSTMPTPVFGDDEDIPTEDEARASEAAAVLGEKDVNGIPWDERIHASTMTKNADGSWKKRRGVDEATVNAVVAELTTPAPAPTTPAPKDGIALAQAIASYRKSGNLTADEQNEIASNCGLGSFADILKSENVGTIPTYWELFKAHMTAKGVQVI